MAIDIDKPLRDLTDEEVSLHADKAMEVAAMYTLQGQLTGPVGKDSWFDLGWSSRDPEAVMDMMRRLREGDPQMPIRVIKQPDRLM
jgi:L-rhamnose isomerase